MARVVAVAVVDAVELVLDAAEARQDEAGLVAEAAVMYLAEEAAVDVWLEAVVSGQGAVVAAAAAAARWLGGVLRPLRRRNLAQVVPQ